MGIHKNRSGTDFSVGEWTSIGASPVGTINASTKVQQKSGVMVRGQLVNDINGQPKLMISEDPRVVERKIAIQQLKKQLHGFPDIETETMSGKPGKPYRPTY